MPKLLRAVLLGCVGAAIVHIAIVMLMPFLSAESAWDRLERVASLNQTVLLPAEPDGPIALLDPNFLAAACRFDLSRGPVAIAAAGSVPFWSASLYDRDSNNLYSLTDRSVGGGVNLQIVRPEQAVALEEPTAADGAVPVQIELDAFDAMILVRAFVPDPTQAESVAGFLRSLTCTTEEIGAAAPQ